MSRLTVLGIVLCALMAGGPAFAQQAPAAVEVVGVSGAGGAPLVQVQGDQVAEGEEEGEGDAEAVVEEEEEAPFPVSGSVSVGGSFGAASVLSNSEFTQTDFFSSRVGLGLNYTVTEDISLSAGIGYSKFLTEDGSVFQREGRLSDTDLGVGLPGWTDEEYTGISIAPGLGFSFPTSDLSIAEGKIMAVSADLSFSRSFGGLSLSYSFGASKNWHKFTSVVLDADELDVIARAGGVENVGSGLVAIDGVLPSFGFSHSFGANFGFLDDFSAGLSLSYFDDFSYDNGTILKDDEFTPTILEEQGLDITRRSQGVSGGLRLGYKINDWLSASASSSTSGSIFASDGKSIRFPFWDFENGISSRTRLSLGLSARY